MFLYGVIGYHVTLSEGHMIANHPIHVYGGDWLSCDPITPYKQNTCATSCGNFDLLVTHLFILYKG